MDTEGLFAPETREAVFDTYEMLAPAAETVTKELARELTSDADEYDDATSPETILTAQETLFASLLEVRTGTRDTYEEWCTDCDADTIERGSEHVSHVAWHHAPAADTVVAATYQDEREAAVGTLRRQAFGTVYREILEGAR